MSEKYAGSPALTSLAAQLNLVLSVITGDLRAWIGLLILPLKPFHSRR